MTLSLTKSQLRATFAKLRVYLTEGYEAEEIAGLMGFSWEDYEELLHEFYKYETTVIQDRTTEQVYVDYCLAQMQNIADLTKVFESFKTTKQHSAMVAAIKARSDIHDKIIARGQEFGFIEKKPEAKFVAGVLVAQLTDKDLRKAITDQVAHLDSLMSQFGGGESIIDIDPGPSHLATPKQKALPDGQRVKGHARNTVHKGRRVVKEKAR